MINIILLISIIVWLSNADEECRRKFSVRRNAIILTKSSQAKGASFIQKKVVFRFQDCYTLCCNNPECTVAVFENKINHMCFLFNCKQPNICSFTEHSNYISMMYIKPETKQNKYVKMNTEVSKHSIDGKLGELCGAVRKCGPENSMCTSGTCICQLGFIGRDGQCMRSMCPKPELMFQCHDVSKMPFCVAIYDQCNGLIECGDGSDELNCEDKARVTRPKNKTTNFLVPKKPDRKPADNSESRQYITRAKSEKSHSVPGDNGPHYLHHITNDSAHSARFQQSVLGRPRVNSHVERQLLVLDSQNSQPKYESPSRRERMKLQRIHSKPQRESRPDYETPPYSKPQRESRPDYETSQYSKLKTSSYPHLTKLEEYYRKNGLPYSGSESGSRYSSSSGSSGNNNQDSHYSDYDYPPPSFNGANNRDQGSDWYETDSVVPYQDTGKYSGSDHNSPGSYSDFLDSGSDDDGYSKSQNPYAGYNYYYDDKGYSRKAFEHLMDHDKFRGTEKSHRIFVKPKPKVVVPISVTQLLKPNEAADNSPVSSESTEESRNMQEWTTAVVVLSMGLLITGAFLVAISLKMRSWRRRLRKGGKKGKSLVTGESDYLINGMYL